MSSGNDDVSVVKQRALSGFKRAYDVAVNRKAMAAKGDLPSSSHRNGRLMGFKLVQLNRPLGSTPRARELNAPSLEDGPDGPEYEKRLDGLKVTNNVGPTGADSKVVRLELI
uniref:Uncharacterized protein n=1 Tax=Cucumis sativus TaxID=3659 RepID=A0A0A0KC36_CUCSA